MDEITRLWLDYTINKTWMYSVKGILLYPSGLSLIKMMCCYIINRSLNWNLVFGSVKWSTLWAGLGEFLDGTWLWAVFPGDIFLTSHAIGAGLKN